MEYFLYLRFAVVLFAYCNQCIRSSPRAKLNNPQTAFARINPSSSFYFPPLRSSLRPALVDPTLHNKDASNSDKTGYIAGKNMDSLHSSFGCNVDLPVFRAFCRLHHCIMRYEMNFKKAATQKKVPQALRHREN